MRRRMEAEAIDAGAIAPDAHRRELRHDAARENDGSRLAEHRRDARLEVADERAVAVMIGVDAARTAPRGDRRELLGRRRRAKAGNDDAQRFFSALRSASVSGMAFVHGSAASMPPAARRRLPGSPGIRYRRVMRFSHVVGTTTWRFADLKDLLAKASPLRSGDVLAGVAATSAEERVAARMCLADAAAVDVPRRSRSSRTRTTTSRG